MRISDWSSDVCSSDLTTYNNMQTQSTAIPYNVTATDFKFRGVEAEFEARPVHGLSLFASVGYLDAKTLSGANVGQRPRLTQDLPFSGGGAYRAAGLGKT